MARFAEKAALVVSLDVGHCACDWGPPSHDALRSLAETLLAARDVSRVRFGVWQIRAGVDDGDPSGRPVEIERHDLDSCPLGLRAPYAIELKRPDRGPHPRARLATIARA